VVLNGDGTTLGGISVSPGGDSFEGGVEGVVSFYKLGD